MADGVCNIALGRVKEYYNSVENNVDSDSALVIVLLSAAEADDTLRDYDDLATLIAAAGNTEADFTNYARKVLTDADLSAVAAPDDTNNRWEADLPDQTWSAAGGTTDNTLVKMLVCYDPTAGSGTDSEIIPLTFHDFNATTDGNDLVASIAAAGFYRAQG